MNGMNRLAACLLPLLGCVFAQAQIRVTSISGSLNVSVNGEPVVFQGTGPTRVGDRVLVPLRGVMEKIGATVNWDAATKTVTAQKDSTSLVLKVGERWATLNDTQVALDAPALILEGTTLVPLRFMGEALGTEVIYEQIAAPSDADIAGVWYLLDSSDAFVKTTKITFKAGKFLFQGAAWKSEGTYQYLGDRVNLIWGSVDGEAVKPGSMAKTLPVTESATRMQLDRFRYGKYPS